MSKSFCDPKKKRRLNALAKTFNRRSASRSGKPLSKLHLTVFFVFEDCNWYLSNVSIIWLVLNDVFCTKFMGINISILIPYMVTRPVYKWVGF